MIRFDHFNFNVFDLEQSLDFYKKALGLELTWLRDRDTPYNLGDLEYHLAFVTNEYEAFYARHQEMGCVCFDNREMGIYFIQDPDGYWIEIVPER